MCRIICKYSKRGNLKYISHLDVLRFIQRSVKRAGLPAKYSEGFNPHMKTSFGFPLSLGTESIGEYFELELVEKIEVNDFIRRMNFVFPKEMQILKADYINDTDSIMARCAFAEYIINLEIENLDFDKFNILLSDMLNEGIIYKRQKKNKKNKVKIKEINTKELISCLNAKKVSDCKVSIEAVFCTTQSGSMKTDELIKLIEENGFKITYYTIMKIDALDKNKEPIL